MFWAFATPTSGVAWSSNGTNSTLKPRSVMDLLSCLTARAAPFLIAVPRDACLPDRGLCEAILMVGAAAGEHAATNTMAPMTASWVETLRRGAGRLPNICLLPFRLKNQVILPHA